MARTNGPFGPSGALQRRPGHDPFGAPAAPAGQWPPHQQQGYGVPAPAAQSVQGYHFPPPEPGYGYTPQPLGGQQQWGQPAAAPQGYELSYQGYNDPGDPSPFQNQQPHQGYADQDAEYGGEEYFEDEEPRRGKRWILIAAALVGAIGVGGALAYTYRSLVAPGPGRVPIAKVDSAAKAKPDYRGAAAERKLPTGSAEEPAQSASEPPAETANVGPRVVRPIPIAPGGVAAAPEPAPAASVPGITLYRPPALPQPQAPALAPSPAETLPAPQPPVRPAAPPAQAAPQPPARVAIGSRPPASESDDEPARTAKRPPVQTAALHPSPTKPPAPKAASSGLGYVAVLSSKKTSMEALEVFADMQQQYPEVLEKKTPDVQSADLSARGLGTMYRLVVGPPGSHNAARSVCAQLKTAGYEGCWVKEY